MDNTAYCGNLYECAARVDQQRQENVEGVVQDFLELVLQDEIDRRDQVNLQRRLQRAQFEEEQTFEHFDWDAPVTFDRDRVRDLFSLAFLQRKEDVIFAGPVGVGKTFLARALGHAACRAGKNVLSLRGATLLKELTGPGPITAPTRPRGDSSSRTY